MRFFETKWNLGKNRFERKTTQIKSWLDKLQKKINDLIWFDLIWFDLIWFDLICSVVIWSDSIYLFLFYSIPILLYSLLIYYILIYSILIYSLPSFLFTSLLFKLFLHCTPLFYESLLYHVGRSLTVDATAAFCQFKDWSYLWATTLLYEVDKRQRQQRADIKYSQNKHRSTKISGEKVLKKKKFIDIYMKERVGDRIGDSKAAPSFTLLIIFFPFLLLSAY